MEIIEQCGLENTMTLTVYDQSKKMAGDRWLVKVVCEATLPVTEGFYSRLPVDDVALHAEIREKIAGVITFSVTKERTFVAESERAALVDSMVSDIKTNMTVYLSRPEFPERLFARKYEELRSACVMAGHYRNLRQESCQGDSEEGPADFSSCFKD